MNTISGKQPLYTLAFIYFFLGFAAIIVQTVLIREFLVISHGNELIIGTFFSSWFLWIVLGAVIGSVWLRRLQVPYPVFWIILFAGFVFFPLQVLGIRLGREILSVPIGTIMPFSKSMFWAFLCTAPFSLMIGLTFPFGAHLHRLIVLNKGKIIGHIYVSEAAGSLLGGLLFTFFWVSRYDAFKTSWLLLLLLMAVMVISGRAILLYRNYRWFIAIAILIGLIFTMFSRSLQDWTIKQRWQSIGGRQNQLIFSFETPYNHNSIASIDDQFSLFQNGQLAFSFPDPYSTEITANTIILQHPHPGNILVISDGIHDLLHALLRYRNIKIDWVLYDQKLLTSLDSFLSDSVRADLDSKNVSIFMQDGRNFIRKQTDRYDIIYLDLSQPFTAVSNRFYTVEFFKQAKNALCENGILVFRLPVSENYMGDEQLQYAASIYKSLQKVFTEVVITAGDQNFVFAAKQKNELITDPAKLIQRWQERGAKGETFSPYIFNTYFQPEHRSFIKDKLESESGVRLNTDEQPMSYYYNLLLWTQYTGGDRVVSSVFRSVERLHFLYLVIFLVILFLARILWIRVKSKQSTLIHRWNSLASVAAAGFTAMGLAIILLFGFQNLYGSLYKNVALVTAIFMSGLSFGSWILNRRLTRIQQLRIWFIFLELIAAVIAFLLPISFQFFTTKMADSDIILSQTLYLGVVLIVGMITGAVFPLAGKGVLQSGKDVGETAGRVDAADHIGACIGAFLMGTFLMPVLGMQGATYVVILVNILAILFWLFVPSQKAQSELINRFDISPN